MKKVKLSYIIGENVYNSINNLTNYSKEIIGTSTNLITELSKLFDQIEDEVTSEILSEASKINDFISSISSFTKNELQEIKIKSKIAIEKAEKRKGKISMLKEENQKLKEVIKDAETEKKPEIEEKNIEESEDNKSKENKNGDEVDDKIKDALCSINEDFNDNDANIEITAEEESDVDSNANSNEDFDANSDSFNRETYENTKRVKKNNKKKKKKNRDNSSFKYVTRNYPDNHTKFTKKRRKN